MLHAKPSSRPLAIPQPIESADDEPFLLHEFFTRAARQWPDQIAIETPPSAANPNRRTITYAELDRRSDAVAAQLREHVRGESFVAILLPRDSEQIYLAQLAVLKAGAAYVCIDPSFPDSQTAYILDDAKPVALVTDTRGAARARGIKPGLSPVLNLVECVDRGRAASRRAEPDWLSSRALAYAIYTSGTTGRPKGVLIEHGAVANLIQGNLATLGVVPEDRIGQNSSCAYDSSVEEIWMTLSAGATLVVMDDDTTRLGPDLVPWLRRERITIFSPPPTLLRGTGCESPEKELPLLRQLHVGGEPMTDDVAQTWSRIGELFNDYGPTECSVTATRALIEPGDEVTIGKPLPGFHAWVMNDCMQEVADGEQGELCLGGAGLARGYLNDPGLTARKFPIHSSFGRIYRTGDLVHRDSDGNLVCHGRIDSQVKVRGYRIELEAIETQLVRCAGVREAACRVQGEGVQQQIVAFIVPNDPSKLPSFDSLKQSLRQELPAYMTPSRFGVLGELPRSVSGKVNRRALPVLEGRGEESGPVVAPRGPIEAKIAAAFAKVLGLVGEIGVDRDFFHDLGGDSLRAAMAISTLRDDPATASLAVRDVYEARTVERLALRVRPLAPKQPPGLAVRPLGHPLLATLAQCLWLALGLVLAGPIAYFLAYRGVPELTRELGLAPFVLASPLILFLLVGVYAAGAIAFAVGLKKLLIGRYRPLCEPVWGSFYVRNWMVTQAVRLIPWPVLDGTIFEQVVFRWLGARIGRRVHIHRGVNLLHGGWDLLDIGDDATLSREVSLRLVDLHEGRIVVAPITIGNGCTLESRSGMGGGSRMERDSYLTFHTFVANGTTVPAGEKWCGVPAAPAGIAPATPTLPEGHRELSPVLHGLALMLGRLFLSATGAIPLAIAAFAFSWFYGIGAGEAAEWILHPALDGEELLLGIAILIGSVPLMLVGQCFAMRSLGRIREGTISRWSLAYVRVWLKMEILDSINGWLSGTICWRLWLRGAGMRIGKRSELSTIFDTVPELTEIGTDTFLADGIFLGGPRVHRGAVELCRTRLGDNDFLGNYAVISPGTSLPDGVLLGVCTTADPAIIRPGSSWFGHPPFELPKREILEEDIGLTYRPSRLRYAHRLFWESLRFTMPVAPALLVLAWFSLMGLAEESFSLPVLLFAIVPLLDLGVLAALCLFGLFLKWTLLGRVKPGTHGFWSFWCFRWDFHYTIWHYCCHGPLAALEGTLLINWYLRAMGVKIGRRAVIGDVFAMVVDPDMIEVADHATVNALFQAHTFEDRVLKIDKVRIGERASVGSAATLLYGADIGDGAEVSPHSVVMKHEKLQPDQAYSGCPTRLLERGS